MPNSNNVTASKPKVGGAVYRAPKGTALPTDATTALNVAFKDLGYISEDGITNSRSIESQETKAWGGDVVVNSQTGAKDGFKMKLIESLNLETLKTVFGDSNVSGTLEAGITVKNNSKELQESAYVIEMVLKGGILKRICIPQAKPTEFAEVVYKDSDVTGYEITLSTTPDASGQTHYEYIKKATE